MHARTHTHTWSTVPTTSEVKSSLRVLSPPGGITQRNLANLGVSSDSAIAGSLLQTQGKTQGKAPSPPHTTQHTSHYHHSPPLALSPSILTHTHFTLPTHLTGSSSGGGVWVCGAGEGGLEFLLSRLLLDVAERLSTSVGLFLLPALAEVESGPASFSAAPPSDMSMSGATFTGSGPSEWMFLKEVAVTTGSYPQPVAAWACACTAADSRVVR